MAREDLIRRLEVTTAHLHAAEMRLVTLDDENDRLCAENTRLREALRTPCAYCQRHACAVDPCSTELHRRADKAREDSSDSAGEKR